MTDAKPKATTERKDRTTIGLDEGSTKQLDALITREAEASRNAGGVGVPPSRGAVVAALIRNAHDAKPAEATPATA